MRKTFIILISLFLIGINAKAQYKGLENLHWQSTDFDFYTLVGGSKQDPGTALRQVSAVNTEIAWCTFADWQVANAPTLPKIGFTTDGGDSWNVVDGPGDPRSQYSNICAIDAKTAWVAVHTESPGLYYTKDAGASWQKVTGIFEKDPPMCNFVYFWDKNIGIAEGDVVDGQFIIYRTEDGGITWSTIPLAASGSELGGVSGMYDVALDGTLYWQSDQGRVYKTTDQGKSFSTSMTGFKNTNQQQGLKVMDENTVIFPAFDSPSKSYDYKITKDGGLSWTEWIPLGENDTFGTFSFCSVPGTSYLVSISADGSQTGGTDNFISYTMDGTKGEEWYIFEDWLAAEQDKTQLSYVKFFNFNGVLKGYASSFNYGPTYQGMDGILVWDGQLPNSVEDLGSKKNRETVEIYPNPTTDKIYFSNVSEITKISLINTIGQTVKTIENPKQNQGMNTSEVEKGFYIISIQTKSGNILTNKVLIK